MIKVKFFFPIYFTEQSTFELKNMIFRHINLECNMFMDNLYYKEHNEKKLAQMKFVLSSYRCLKLKKRFPQAPTIQKP